MPSRCYGWICFREREIQVEVFAWYVKSRFEGLSYRDLKFSGCKRETSEKRIRKNGEKNIAEDGMQGRLAKKRLKKK